MKNIIVLLIVSLLLNACSSSFKKITEANSPQPILKGKKHLLVPGNAYKIKKPKK